MFNLVLWALDNECNPFLFERLCTDLMFRNGYTSIIPFGRVKDRGRDAQIKYQDTNSQTKEITFFQYSLQKTWENKLKKEIEKIINYGHTINTLIFVTSQGVSGEKRDKLENLFLSDYQCEIIIYDREWLRFQLEEPNKDLAKKYLGIPNDSEIQDIRETIRPSIPSNSENVEAYSLFVGKDYEHALPKLKSLLDGSMDASIWRCIAWCYYILWDYKNALYAINKSLDLEIDFWESLSIKACILTESGVSEKSREKLLVSQGIFLKREVFSGFQEHEMMWMYHYNLGNVFKGLEEFPEAKKEYLEAIKYNEGIAEIWCNLGICMHHLQEYKIEIQYYNKAIELNPSLFQAFVSKANTLGMIFNKYQEAILILNFANERDPELAKEFPYFWYWMAQFQLELNDINAARISVEVGLKNNLDDTYFLDLKSSILSQIWRSQGKATTEIIAFFEMRNSANSSDYRASFELAQIYNIEDNIEKTQFYLSQSLSIVFPNLGINPQVLKIIDIDNQDLINSILQLDIYQGFRCKYPIEILYTYESFAQFSLALEKILWVYFLVAFNELINFWLDECKSEEPIQGRKIEELLLASYKKSFDSLNSVVQKSSNYIGLLACNEMEEVKVEIITSLILIFPELILLESSRHVGYVLTLVPINKQDLQFAMENISFSEHLSDDWESKIRKKILDALENHFQLFDK